MHTRTTSLALFLCSALLSVAAMAAVTDAEYARMREAAQIKFRKVIIDNDGCDVSAFPGNREPSIQGITDYFNGHCLGYPIDAISYCPGCTAFKMTHRSKVADLNYFKMHVAGLQNTTQWLHQQGTDGLELASRFARRNGYEVFANMRINDLHDRWAPRTNYAPWMMAHPEWLVGDSLHSPPFGSWLQFNFAIPQVRERFMAIVEELVTYDVDGLIVDMCRFPVLFPSVGQGDDASDAEREAITRLFRELRAMVDRVGKEKGHYLMLMMKVPDGMETNYAIGIDVAKICDEKLLDILIVGSDVGRSVPYAEAVKMGQAHGTKTYLSVEAWNGANRQSRDCLELYQGQAAAAWQAHPDGLFYFNFFYHSSLFGAIKRTPQELLLTDKTYFGRHHSRPDYAAQCARFQKLDAVDGTQIALGADKPARVLMETGMEFGRNDIAEKSPAVQLVVHTRPGTPPIAASINGKPLGKPMVYSKKQLFAVDYWDVKPGQNWITLQLTEPAKPVFQTLFTGKQIIRYSSEVPWRRLWAFYVHDKEHDTERITADNAMRLDDFLGEPGKCVNFYYPVSATAGHLAGSFEMRLEYSDTPEASMFRIGNGRKVEMVTFQPGEVALKYAGKQAAFRTDDAFHTYEWAILEGDVFQLKADGQLLFETPMVMDASNPAARVSGNADGLPYMHERSIFIGSLSEAGKGATCWRNFQYCDGICITATELDFSYHKASYDTLTKAFAEAPAEGTVLYRYSAADGKLPQKADGWNCNYEEGRLTISPEGTLLIDNTSEADTFATITHHNPPESEQAGRVLRLKWRSRVRQATGNGFMLGLRLKNPATGKSMSFTVQQQRELIHSPAGADAKLTDGVYADCQAWIELDTGHYLMMLDGQVMDMGTLPEVNAPPLLFFGDGSSSCTGIAELEDLSLEIVK